MKSPEKYPELTVVIATYGHSKYLIECIASLKNQSQPCRIMASTSTPNDDLIDTCREQDVPLRIHHAGGSISMDWNAALAASPTALTLIAHQDDIYFPEFLSECLKLWNRNPDLLMSFSNHVELDEQGRRRSGLNVFIKRGIVKLAFQNSSIANTPNVRRALFAVGNPISCPSVIINKAQLPNFKFSQDWSINLDWEAWARICEETGQIGYVNEALLAHRVHCESETTKSLSDSRRQLEDVKMFHRYWPSPLARLISWIYSLSYISNSK